MTFFGLVFVDWLLGLFDETMMLVGSVGLVVAERVLVIPDILDSEVVIRPNCRKSLARFLA